MNAGVATFAGHVDPESTWRVLQKDAGAYLVDVRSEAEWAFVGAPDLASLGKRVWTIAWKSFPGMVANQSFYEDLAEKIGESGATAIYFICRSGGRSHEAAVGGVDRLRPPGTLALYNVAEGFEGDLDDDSRRGRVNGWKARGLPWRQS